MTFTHCATVDGAHAPLEIEVDFTVDAHWETKGNRDEPPDSGVEFTPTGATLLSVGSFTTHGAPAMGLHTETVLRFLAENADDIEAAAWAAAQSYAGGFDE